MKDALYAQVVQKWNETTDLPPQTAGPFTPLYKSLTKRLKVMPWPALLAGGILVVSVLYLLFGPGISFITTLLQRGF